MIVVAQPVEAATGTSFRELVWPKEHGSWSLAFEPLILGLAVAPSIGGAWLAFAAATAFFVRRPLQRLMREQQPARRASASRALGLLSALAGAGVLLAIVTAGVDWLVYVIPSLVAGGLFLLYDMRGAGREGAAEIAGAAAFGALPAALAALGGLTFWDAFAVAAVMVGRSVPAVMVVRAFLRGQKTGVWNVWPAVSAAILVLVPVAWLVRAGHAPGVMLGLLALLAVRTVLLAFSRPKLRARTLGMGEAVAGVIFVIVGALSWSA